MGEKNKFAHTAKKYFFIYIMSGECAFGDRPFCAPKSDLDKIWDLISTRGGNPSTKPKNVVEAAKRHFGVKSEAALWQLPEVKMLVGPNRATKILRDLFKPAGPADSTDLLDNYNIDDTLSQWSRVGDKMFGKKFYHVPFQMIDFMNNATELATLDIAALTKNGYDSFGVIINTDVSTGGGKHWFAIYGDLGHKGTEDDPIALEYFNSSGNPPMAPINLWMETVCHNLLRDHNIHCKIVRSAPRRLQHSNTECGMWSLMYIKSRLQGHPPNWFYQSGTTDDDMIRLRKHIFRIA